MYKLMFEKQGKYFIMTIENRKIIVSIPSVNFQHQYLPRYEKIMDEVILKVRNSRNKIPAYTIDLFAIPEDELEEYNQAKTDEELREIVLKDCKKNNYKLIKEEKI